MNDDLKVDTTELTDVSCLLKKNQADHPQTLVVLCNTLIHLATGILEMKVFDPAQLRELITLWKEIKEANE